MMQHPFQFANEPQACNATSGHERAALRRGRRPRRRVLRTLHQLPRALSPQQGRRPASAAFPVHVRPAVALTPEVLGAPGDLTCRPAGRVPAGDSQEKWLFPVSELDLRDEPCRLPVVDGGGGAWLQPWAPGESGEKGSNQIPGCLPSLLSLPSPPPVAVQARGLVCSTVLKPSGAERLPTGEESAGRGLPEAVGGVILTVPSSVSVFTVLRLCWEDAAPSGSHTPFSARLPGLSGAFRPLLARRPPPLAPALRHFHLRLHRRFCSCCPAFVSHQVPVFSFTVILDFRQVAETFRESLCAHLLRPQRVGRKERRPPGPDCPPHPRPHLDVAGLSTNVLGPVSTATPRRRPHFQNFWLAAAYPPDASPDLTVNALMQDVIGDSLPSPT
ncbi:uncharacterized protein LOC125089512 [Lutra lutra]|uniref:uncharacterized protein LOC125089512 n=1 Tax=Lutra lutra TaxID=9657 RepID=UPI001FD5E2D4|nr:uncharacterized protein LOC125089512 [Lutra lutra]